MDKQDAEGGGGGMRVRAAADAPRAAAAVLRCWRRCLLPPPLMHAARCCVDLQADGLSDMFEGLRLAGRPETCRDDDLVGQFRRMGLTEGREALPARGPASSLPQVGPRHAARASVAMAWGAAAPSQAQFEAARLHAAHPPPLNLAAGGGL